MAKCKKNRTTIPNTVFKDHDSVNQDHILNTESPVNYFKMFFDNDMINHIAVHTICTVHNV